MWNTLNPNGEETFNAMKPRPMKKEIQDNPVWPFPISMAPKNHAVKWVFENENYTE